MKASPIGVGAAAGQAAAPNISVLSRWPTKGNWCPPAQLHLRCEQLTRSEAPRGGELFISLDEVRLRGNCAGYRCSTWACAQGAGQSSTRRAGPKEKG